MKKTLLLILSVCFLFAAVGCSSGTDYSSDIDRLNAQIEQLQSELNALKGENSDTDALKEQIAGTNYRFATRKRCIRRKFETNFRRTHGKSRSSSN